LGITVVDLRYGTGVLSLDYDQRLVGNPRTGNVHDGAITTLLDTVSGLVVMAAVPDDVGVATLDLRIDYLRPATPERPMFGRATCYRRTQNVAFVRGSADHGDAADPIATCAGTFMLGAGGYAAAEAASVHSGGEPARAPAGAVPSAAPETAEPGPAGDVPAVNRRIPYAATLGLETLPGSNGLVAVLRHRDTNIGNSVIRSVHGGVVGALLEHAAILHLLAEAEAETIPKTINVSIDYLRPCLEGDTFARGTVIKQGRRIANVRVEAWQDDPARPVAAAHAHFLLI